ncbi:MAG: WG repeat-containing protein [Bacteroidia bacterium]|nr:WG repeat-containing protein [Bacteroidia bacterium]
MWKHITISVVSTILIMSCSKKGSKAKVGTMDDFSSLPEPSLIPFREGRWNSETFEMENRYGLADASDPNKILISPQFSFVWYVPEEEVYLCEREPSKESSSDKKHQYIIYDKKGKELLILRDDEKLNPFDIGSFQDGLIVFRKDEKEGSGKYGAFNLAGKEVIVPQYDALELIGQNLAIARVKDKWTLIEVSGDKAKELFPPRYSNIRGYISEDLIVVKENDRYGYINTKGEQIIPCQYEDALPFSEGLAPVAIGKKWGYIDKSGKEVIRPEYEKADMFVNGFARVQKDDNHYWGFINAKGELVVSPRYDEVGTFVNGIAPVRTDKNWGCINEKGELFIPLSYQEIIRYPSVDVIAVKKDNKWGFLTFSGKELVSPRYDDFNGFGNNGLAAVKIGKKWGYADKEGNMVIPANYDKAFPFMPCTELAVVYENGKINYIDKKGNKLIKEDISKNAVKELRDIHDDLPLEIGYLAFMERSHPILMHRALRFIYAAKHYGSLLCYMGMDIVSGKGGEGYISPKGVAYWKEEKPSFMKAVGEWEGEGKFQLVSSNGKEEVKIEKIQLSIGNPSKIEREGGKKVGVVPVDATISSSYSFPLEIKNDELVSSDELPYYYSLQEYVRALLAVGSTERGYTSYDIDKIKLSVRSTGDNEIELSIGLENVRKRVYQDGEEFSFEYPKATLRTTLKPSRGKSDSSN